MQFRPASAAALLLLVSACAQVSSVLDRHRGTAAQQSQEFLPDGGPPVVNGFYDAHGSCPFEGCSMGDLYTTGPVELLERPALDARVIATAPAGEWVSAGDNFYRHRPARGVVVGEVRYIYDNDGDTENGRPTLEIGDVVYATDFGGEGLTELWRRGERMWWDSAGGEQDGVNDGIRWAWGTSEQHEADVAAGGGWWLELVRANGERGWVRETGNLDCLGMIDPSPRCQERWAAASGR
ncbi:MAG: hypothetical protein A4S17_13965 [Proteobacteria bacterium HN_bin10]|nr:MAG: hypothetical protein A4S17_13965 [Proteobacteria bacterium HN_bin10]